MLGAAASLLNIKVVILDAGEHAPAKQVLSPLSTKYTHLDGSFSDPAKIKGGHDVVTAFKAIWKTQAYRSFTASWG